MCSNVGCRWMKNWPKKSAMSGRGEASLSIETVASSVQSNWLWHRFACSYYPSHQMKPQSCTAFPRLWPLATRRSMLVVVWILTAWARSGRNKEEDLTGWLTCNDAGKFACIGSCQSTGRVSSQCKTYCSRQRSSRCEILELCSLNLECVNLCLKLMANSVYELRYVCCVSFLLVHVRACAPRAAVSSWIHGVRLCLSEFLCVLVLSASFSGQIPQRVCVHVCVALFLCVSHCVCGTVCTWV